MSPDQHATVWPVLFIAIGALCLYLLPSIIGFKRGVSSRFVLLLMNLFVGWTVLMWVVCLIWAVTGATRAQDEFYKAQARQA